MVKDIWYPHTPRPSLCPAGLYREQFTALLAAALHYTLTTRGAHTHQKAVRACALALFGLIGSFGCHSGEHYSMEYKKEKPRAVRGLMRRCAA